MTTRSVPVVKLPAKLVRNEEIYGRALVLIEQYCHSIHLFIAALQTHVAGLFSTPTSTSSGMDSYGQIFMLGLPGRYNATQMMSRYVNE